MNLKKTILGCSFSTLVLGILSASGSALEGEERESRISSLQRGVEQVMNKSEEELRAMVPDNGGLRFAVSPATDLGSDLHGDWSYDPARPFEIVCNLTGTVFPNDEFPEDRYIVLSEGEEPIKIPYYLNEETGNRYFVSQHINFLLRSYMETRLPHLHELYELTGDEDYLRAGAIILDEISIRFPHYPYSAERPRTEPRYFAPDIDSEKVASIRNELGQNRPARWHWWMNGEFSRFLLDFYRNTRYWDGWSEIGDGKSHERIENDVFTPMGDLVMSMEEVYYNTSLHNWASLLIGGALLGRSDWVEEGKYRLSQFLEIRFFHDGSWMEASSSYGEMIMPGLDRLEQALVITKESFENPQEEDIQALEALRKKVSETATGTRNSMRKQVMPHGRYIPVNDTFSWQSPPDNAPPPTFDSATLPGVGLVMIRPDLETLLLFNASSGRFHQHYAPLSLLFYTDDTEWLSDIGYSHSNIRGWTFATHSHNTVVVNGENARHDREWAATGLTGWFYHDQLPFSFAAGETNASYPGITDLYRRVASLLESPSGDGYLLVDIFEVKGGRVRDLIHMGPLDQEAVLDAVDSSWEEAEGAPSAPFANFGNPESFDPRYSLLTKTRRLDTNKTPLRVRWRGEENDMQSIFLAPKTLEILASRAPSVRPTQDANTYRSPRNDLVFDFTAPHLIVRCQDEGTFTRFVTVHVAGDLNLSLDQLEWQEDQNGGSFSVRWPDGTKDRLAVRWDDPLPDSEPSVYWTRKTDNSTAMESVRYRWPSGDQRQERQFGLADRIPDEDRLYLLVHGEDPLPILLESTPVFLTEGRRLVRSYSAGSLSSYAEGIAYFKPAKGEKSWVFLEDEKIRLLGPGGTSFLRDNLTLTVPKIEVTTAYNSDE